MVTKQFRYENEEFTMQETCFICGRKQLVNDPFTIYDEPFDFALCGECEINEDLKKGFNLGWKKAVKIMQKAVKKK